MTAYWDDWLTLILAYFDEDKHVPDSMFEDALRELIDALHEYDHTHGGHVLDSYCSQQRSLERFLKPILCSLEGHHWVELDDGRLKCLYCKFSANKQRLKHIGWLEE